MRLKISLPIFFAPIHGSPKVGFFLVTDQTPQNRAFPANWLASDPALHPGPAVIFDIDGVLANAEGRQHLITGGQKNWGAFFDAVGEDVLIDEMALLLAMLQPELQVVLLTGRPHRVQDKTVEWLGKHQVRWDLLIMRDMGDYSKAREFKQNTIHQLRDAGFHLHLSFEDDQRNAEMFRSEGVPCVYIHSGYYD